MVLATLIKEGPHRPVHHNTYALVWPEGMVAGSMANEALDGYVKEVALQTFAKGTLRLATFETHSSNGTGETQTYTVHFDLLEPKETLLIIGSITHAKNNIKIIMDLL